MAGYNESGMKTFAVTEAIAQYLRIKIGASGISIAGAADIDDGTIEVDTFEVGELAAVRLNNMPGTRKMVAAGEITAGSNVYAAAGGKVASTGSILKGKAISAATADGDYIEVLTIANDAATAPVSLAAAGSAQGDAGAIAGSLVVVTASDGTKGVRLPAITVGARVEVYNSVASQGLKVYPATGGNINGGSTNAAITMAGKTFARFVAVDATTWAASFDAPA